MIAGFRGGARQNPGLIGARSTRRAFAVPILASTPDGRPYDAGMLSKVGSRALQSHRQVLSRERERERRR